MAERPGIMFYFDVLTVLEDFTNDEIGQMFLAVMRYGSTGEITEFNDRGMRSVMRSLMQYADRDLEAFNLKVLKKQYAGYISSQKKKGITEDRLPNYDEWFEKIYIPSTNPTDADTCEHVLTPVNRGQQNQPTTTTTSISTSTSTPASESTINYNNQHQLSKRMNGGEEIRGSGREEEQSNRSFQPAGYIPPEIRDLFSEWNTAMISGDKDRAFALDWEIKKAGYLPDPITGQITKQ